MFGFRKVGRHKVARDDAPTPATTAFSATMRHGDESEAHLRLLSAFLIPSRLDVWPQEPWQSALGESPQQAFDRWIAAGLLRPASATVVVAALWPLTQIRALLRERGLNASGTKAVMVARLLEADPDLMSPQSAGTYYMFAGDVNDIHRRVPLAQRPRPPTVMKTALQHLRERNIAGAVRSVAAYHAAGIFPSGYADQWAKPSHWRDRAQLLTQLFTSWPAIVDAVPLSARGPYRVAAGMMALFDTGHAREWLDSKTPKHPRLSSQAVARMVLFAAEHEHRRKRWRADDVTKLHLVFPDDVCSVCQALHHRVFSLRMLPTLPPVDCMCDDGFLGRVVADTEPVRSGRPHQPGHWRAGEMTPSSQGACGKQSTVIDRSTASK